MSTAMPESTPTVSISTPGTRKPAAANQEALPRRSASAT